MRALKSEITNEIRYILEGCRSGALRHHQGSFHKQTSCGTAHCIAGWNVVLKSNTSEELGEFGYGNDEWNESKEDWQLTDVEANLLFNSTSTFRIQFSLLETLEAGHRINDNVALLDATESDDKEETESLEKSRKALSICQKAKAGVIF